jgi:hypothetical protein
LTARKPGYPYEFPFRLAARPERSRRDPELDRVITSRYYTPESYERAMKTTTFDVPTDDWPYLYLQKRQVPTLHLIMIAIIAALMLISMRALFPGQGLGPGHFLFLGAGFLLVEVHSISKAALLFGSTWIVNVVIISAILVMVLLANIIAARRRIQRVRYWYAGLFISLALSYFVPVQELMVGGWVLRGVLTGLFYSLPLFFAGVIFASSLNRVAAIEAAFAANMLGAALGGMMENLSYLTGLRAVVLVAILLYAASALAYSRLPLRDPA